MIDYLDVQDYRNVAAEVLKIEPAVVPFRDEGAADSALHTIQPVFGHDPHPDVPEKAAVLGYRLARAHPLVDANKRTATVSMILFAHRNGHAVTMPDDALEEAMVAGAAGELDQDDFVALVAPTITPSPPGPRDPTGPLTAEPKTAYQPPPKRHHRRRR